MKNNIIEQEVEILVPIKRLTADDPKEQELADVILKAHKNVARQALTRIWNLALEEAGKKMPIARKKGDLIEYWFGKQMSKEQIKTHNQTMRCVMKVLSSLKRPV